MYRRMKIRFITRAREKTVSSECYPQHMTHGLGSRAGSAWKAPRIFFSQDHIARLDRAPRCRAIISIRGITDVSSFHTVSTSRKLARSTLAASWQLAPKKHRKTSRPVITVAPVLSSYYPASFGSAQQPNTFFRVVCLNSRYCTTQIFTRGSRFSILQKLIRVIRRWFYSELQEGMNSVVRIITAISFPYAVAALKKVWICIINYYNLFLWLLFAVQQIFLLPLMLFNWLFYTCWNIISDQKQCAVNFAKNVLLLSERETIIIY